MNVKGGMSIYLTYGIIAATLVAAELCYFRIADRFNIIDKPNERSSHSRNRGTRNRVTGSCTNSVVGVNT